VADLRFGVERDAKALALDMRDQAGLRLVPKRCSSSCSRSGWPGRMVPSTINSRICSCRKYGIVAGALMSNRLPLVLRNAWYET